MSSIWRVMATFAILCFVAGCGASGEDTVGVGANGDQIATQSEIDAYLRFKRVDTIDERRVEAVVDQYLERRALADVIEKQSLLDKKMLAAEFEDFRLQMLISRYFDEFLKETVTDQAVINYYNAHAERYQEERARVAHVLVRTNPEMSEVERKARLTTAMEAYSKIRAGEDFAEIAKTYSGDLISAKKGGDLGWVKKGSISRSFSEKVFGLHPGELSEPFESPFGYHVVKLLEGPETTIRPFEAVAGDIRHQLRTEAKNAEIERLMEQVNVQMR